MLELLSGMSDGDFYIITKSSAEQYSNSKIKMNKTGEEIKLLNEYEGSIKVFDDILVLSNNIYVDQVSKGE